MRRFEVATEFSSSFLFISFSFFCLICLCTGREAKKEKTDKEQDYNTVRVKSHSHFHTNTTEGYCVREEAGPFVSVTCLNHKAPPLVTSSYIFGRGCPPTSRRAEAAIWNNNYFLLCRSLPSHPLTSSTLDCSSQSVPLPGSSTTE